MTDKTRIRTQGSLLVSCDFLNKYTGYIESGIICEKQFKSM